MTACSKPHDACPMCQITAGRKWHDMIWKRWSTMCLTRLDSPTSTMSATHKAHSLCSPNCRWVMTSAKRCCPSLDATTVASAAIFKQSMSSLVQIKRFFAIAPVASVAHIRGLFRYMTERSYEQLLVSVVEVNQKSTRNSDVQCALW